MGLTLDFLGFSSQSQNRSQFGDQSPSSKATDQQTTADEEGDRLWRRRRRQVQTQGSFSSRSQNRSQYGLVAHVARGRDKLMRKKEHQLTPGSLACSSRSQSLGQ